MPELNGTEADTARMDIMLEIGYYYERFMTDSALWWYYSIIDSKMPAEMIQNYPNRALSIAKAYLYIGYVIRNQGKYTEANKYNKEALRIRELAGDKRGASVSMNFIGLIFLYQGNYPKAIDYFERSLEIREELDDLRGISICLNNLGIVYDYQGNYTAAIDYYERSMKVSEEFDDKSGISYNLNNIGVIKRLTGKYDEAIDFFQRALAIDETNDDKDGIASCYNNLGNVMGDLGNDSLAKIYYEKALKIREETGDKAGIAVCLVNLALKYANEGNYEKAVDYYENAIMIAKELDDYGRLVTRYPGLARVYISMGKLNKALPFYKKAKEITLTQLQDNFMILSEKDRELFLGQTEEIFNELHYFNLNYSEYTENISGICYNNELILKGLLLKSTSAILDIVYDSPDPDLKEAYYLLKQYRDQISSLQGSESDDRDERVSELEQKANEQERKLVRMSSELADLQRLFDYNWKDVRNKLSPGEAAIEFVRFTQKKERTTIYAALVLTHDSDQPQSIALFSEEGLINILGEDVSTGHDYVTKLYGEENHALYNLIWQPLEAYIPGIHTIYYSPVGVLNKIAFSALNKGINNFLCDNYNLIQLSTTGKLLEADDFSMPDEFLAVIYGGINYNIENTKTEQWTYLPGSLVEKKSISRLLRKNNINVETFSGEAATEESVKEIYASQDFQPHILHIATHGFFYPDPEVSLSKQVVERGEVDFRGTVGFGNWMFVNNKNPMMRSGLVFSGANRVWDDEWDRTDNDGVLTAYEVSNMNMRNTNLVVLSACETGLGDVRGSEGVYGLQRAFKMAGVNYIIMSLWQVPDKETVEFMELFYDKLLKNSNIREAFNETQREMRQKYDPFYWAAFVLVE